MKFFNFISSRSNLSNKMFVEARSSAQFKLYIFFNILENTYFF